jgi:hypothetical protein
LAVRVAPDESHARIARAALTSLAKAWRESRFREVPSLARGVAAELLGDYTLDAAARIIRAVGLGRLDPYQQERLSQALFAWELTYADDANSHELPPSVIGIGQLPGRPFEHTDSTQRAWRAWLESTGPDECGDRIATMLVLSEPISSVVATLQSILRGPDDVTARRAAEARTAEQSLSRGERLSRIQEAIAQAFTHRELSMLLRLTLDVRLEDITTETSPMRRQVFDILAWAERHGRLRELVSALAELRPMRQDLQELLSLVKE